MSASIQMDDQNKCEDLDPRLGFFFLFFSYIWWYGFVGFV
jgi:hypothetical protein